MPQLNIVTAPPPTPNGDLHLGHLAGPFLASDVYRRYLQARGRDVVYASYSDDNQSYVVTTAERLGKSPEEVARHFTGEIVETLAMAGIRMDWYEGTGEPHRAFTSRFLAELFDRGVLVAKEKEFFFDTRAKKYLFEAYLSGYCAECFAATKAGICETCGHPNNFCEILEPYATLDPEAPLERRSVTVVVFELERLRERFETYYADKWTTWRPHILRLVRECLERPLPDFPITYPHDWGIRAPFPGFEDQVINAWPELLTGLIVATGHAAQLSERTDLLDGIWRAAAKPNVVQFFGFDNSFFYTFVHLGLLLAYEGRYALQSTMLTNEFFELDNSKFSTSKNHVIWARDLLAKHGGDPVRFDLAWVGPHFQKSNFTLADIDRVLPARLYGPWNRLEESFAALRTQLGGEAFQLHDVALVDLAHLGQTARRFARVFEAETMDLRVAAETVTQILEWLDHRARKALTRRSATGDYRGLAGEAAGLWFLLAGAATAFAPLLPTMASEIAAAIGRVEAWPVAQKARQRLAPLPRRPWVFDERAVTSPAAVA
jgi:methionyl-tRNA synthetase